MQHDPGEAVENTRNSGGDGVRRAIGGDGCRILITAKAVPELLPGESWDVSVSVADMFPAIWLSATSLLTPELAVVAGTTPGIDPVRASAGTWAVPWALLILVVLAGIAIVLALFVARRRRRQRRLQEEARVQKAVEHALREQETNGASALS